MSKSAKPRTATVAAADTLATEHPAAPEGAGEFVLYTTDDSVKVSHKQAMAHAQGEYERFAAQRRTALEAEGAAYAIRMLGAGSTDEKSLGELSQVAKRLAKKKGSK